MNARPAVLSLTAPALRASIQGMGEASFRASQVLRWLYVSGVGDPGLMTNLPCDFRRKLSEAFSFPSVEPCVTESCDGTRKYFFTFSDGASVEAVWIPEGRRKTLCVSSQAGCPLRCSFCVAGAGGFRRDLSVEEIVSQVWQVRCRERRGVTNVVFMGMGEPLLNSTNVLGAIDVLSDVEGMAIGRRKIVVSTVGVLPEIVPFFRAAKVKAAVSITGSGADSSKWMPVRRTWGLEEVIDEFRRISPGKVRKVVVETVLIAGETDTVREATSLSKLLRPMHAVVNVVPYNENPHFPDLRSPSEADVEAFVKSLASRGIRATVRKSRGGDIGAACGQLGAGMGGRDERSI